MIFILKTDITWHPEQINDDKYLLRANKTFTVPGNDFVEYDTGVNLNFPENCDVIFKLHGDTKLKLAGHILKYSNFESTRSTIIKVLNYSKDDVTIKETQHFLTFELLNKGQSETVAEPVAEQVAEQVAEPVAEQVAEPVTEPVAEPVTEQVAEPVAEPVAEQVAEPIADPVAEQVTEQVVALEEVPKKRKYVKRK